MIFLIAFIPALAVLLIAYKTESRFWTWMAAVAASAIGAFIGQPTYLVLDLAAVAFALWVSLAGINGRQKPVVVQPALVKAKPSEDHGIATLVGMIVVAAAIFVFFTPSSQPPATAQAPPSPAANPTKQVATIPLAKAQIPVDQQSHKQRSRAESKITQDQRAANSVPVESANYLTPLEQCLTIPAEAGMVRCLERLK